YRLLEEEGQLAHRGRAKAPEDRIPVRRVATRPNQIWSWDISYLRGPARGSFLYLYLVTDIWSRKVVGWAVHTEESAQLASELIERTARAESVEVDALTLHSDNWGPMKGSTMLATLQALGIAASFTRPRVSDDNPFSEAQFRTLKYRRWFPRGHFNSLQHARGWPPSCVATTSSTVTAVSSSSAPSSATQAATWPSSRHDPLDIITAISAAT
ncbi:MAG: DDE-type integrase/transposase/recombinase, partial [Myxococcota bacterium]